VGSDQWSEKRWLGFVVSQVSKRDLEHPPAHRDKAAMKAQLFKAQVILWG
jgi:hypothetical protein